MLRFLLRPRVFAALIAVLLLLLAWASLWTYFGPLWKHHRAISRLAVAGTTVIGSRGDDWMTESQWAIARGWAPMMANTVEVNGASRALEVGRQLQLLADVHDLKHVRLVDVSLDHADWERLALLESVESMELRELTVTAAGLTELSRTPKLERLDLSAATVEDGALLSLANCPQLKRLFIAASHAARPEVPQLLAQRGDIDIAWVAKLSPAEHENLQVWTRQGVRIEGQVSHGARPRSWDVSISQPLSNIDALIADLRPLGVIEQCEVATPAVSDELVTALAKAGLGTERIGLSGGALTAETLQCLGECATLQWLTLRQVSVPDEALQQLRNQPKLFVELLE